MLKEMIGLRIRELRISFTGLNQEEFANSISMNRTFLSRIESGKQNLTIDVISTICSGLGVSLSDFFRPFINSGEI